ncbi:hypothetical protein CIG19_06220 [Enterobacterales bacterium CwR94]|nr:hypothetical protein CIG19_06220 [Enterobacterales bacterium CwR94]
MEKRIFQMGLDLNAAAEAECWSDVKRLDRQIAELLTALRQQGTTPAVMEQLNLLKKRHAKVVQTCQEELEVLRHKLATHQETREGLQAYELFGEQGGVQ